MSKRSLRKNRHRSDVKVVPFKELVKVGMMDLKDEEKVELVKQMRTNFLQIEEAITNE